MDRNKHKFRYSKRNFSVALRKESVDRNIDAQHLSICVIESLSARRAWIEITAWSRSTCWYSVALRKESVDRNGVVLDGLDGCVVALRKESVDRNRR